MENERTVGETEKEGKVQEPFKDEPVGKAEESNNNTTDEPKKKRKHVEIIIGGIILILLIAAGIFYWRTAVHYQNHFLPNTSINGINCSELNANQVALMLDGEIQEYKLEVTGRLNEEGENGVLGEISAQDINLQYAGTLSAVEHLLERQNEWLWIEKFTNKHFFHDLVQGVDFDEEMLEACVNEWDAFHNMEKPRDAYISEYSEEKGEYEIIPETIGTELDEECAMEFISNAIIMQAESSVNLENAGCYAEAAIKSDDKDLIESVNAVNTWLDTVITYDWNDREVVVDKEIIREWISFEENEPQLDEEAVAEFVSAQAAEYDTYGKYRRFMTTLGVELNLPSGYYGWKTDIEGETAELIQLIYEGSTQEREPLYTSKGRWKGINDIGNTYVEADLTNQHLYLYYQGNLVLETDFVSGAPYLPGCATPAGVFGLSYKTTNAVLRGQDYETPVSYWMPFYGNFGMHDATWRTEFGGDIYLTDGSHGCLNLPLDKAEAIYGYMSEGFPIICYYY